MSAASVSASLLCLRLVTRLRSTLLFSFPPAAGGAGQLSGVGGVWGGVSEVRGLDIHWTLKTVPWVGSQGPEVGLPADQT